jgi:hypothetical protein
LETSDPSSTHSFTSLSSCLPRHEFCYIFLGSTGAIITCRVSHSTANRTKHIFSALPKFCYAQINCYSNILWSTSIVNLQEKYTKIHYLRRGKDAKQEGDSKKERKWGRKDGTRKEQNLIRIWGSHCSERAQLAACFCISLAWLTPWPWKWRQYVLPKLLAFPKLHDIATQEAVLFELNPVESEFRNPLREYLKCRQHVNMYLKLLTSTNWSFVSWKWGHFQTQKLFPR